MDLLAKIFESIKPRTEISGSRIPSPTPTPRREVRPSQGGNFLENLFKGIAREEVISSRPLVQGAQTTRTPQPTATPTPTARPTTTPYPNPKDFWEEFSNIARAESAERGYDADTVIRQKALESNFGRSNFARERNNFGGIGAYDHDPNQAFQFDTPQDYLEYYFNLIENRYPQAYANRQDPRKYVEGLKAGGYASDKDYVWKILNTPLQPK